ncbi:hypothetical protein [Arcanobacterium hippocoleae]|uniref:Uncharacterized protein n=1 Tax=Arcanobacterium hippocoleae TaxID=149017 RepID=A0ABU1T2M4_9ACTO|nr:hypothetical protein [Arcanobacterium hippocoleae]MDR6939500.1 hypothetical protein [Arcanobacterium hippocoleae]
MLEIWFNTSRRYPSVISASLQLAAKAAACFTGMEYMPLPAAGIVWFYRGISIVAAGRRRG